MPTPQQGGNLLAGLTSRRNRRRIFRFESIPRASFRADLQFDANSLNELLAIVATAGYGSDPEELLDSRFRQNSQFRPKTRFSDGSFPVLYASLDQDTAHAEIRFHFLLYAAQADEKRIAHYRQYSCTFEGLETDLRPKSADWPQLTHESDYEFCNRLGAEAVELGIDGLLTPSARNHGTNLPVFKREAVSGVQLGETIELTRNPDSGEVG